MVRPWKELSGKVIAHFDESSVETEFMASLAIEKYCHQLRRFRTLSFL
jgi:hypothetical protein